MRKGVEDEGDGFFVRRARGGDGRRGALGVDEDGLDLLDEGAGRRGGHGDVEIAGGGGGAPLRGEFDVAVERGLHGLDLMAQRHLGEGHAGIEGVVVAAGVEAGAFVPRPPPALAGIAAFGIVLDEAMPFELAQVIAGGAGIETQPRGKARGGGRPLEPQEPSMRRRTGWARARRPVGSGLTWVISRMNFPPRPRADNPP